MSTDPDVLIVGAGLAGLVAARELMASGRTVRLLDEGDAPGGRLATRRVETAALDHGAQFFTVRSDAFAALVDRWRADGAGIDEWSRGFAQASDVRAGPDGVTSTAGDGHPRYVVRGGMRALAGTLARDMDVVSGTRVAAAWVRAGAWHAVVAGGQVHRAKVLVSTCPVPRTLALLDRGGTRLPADADAALRAVTYDPCLALLAVLDRPPPLPPPGGVQFAGGPVRWLADNARKQVSATPAVTMHGDGDWSRVLYDADGSAVADILSAWLAPWIRPAAITTAQVTRWAHARPRDLIDERVLATRLQASPVVFAGDAFGHARVEGAARSGLAAAAVIAGRVT